MEKFMLDSQSYFMFYVSKRKSKKENIIYLFLYFCNQNENLNNRKGFSSFIFFYKKNALRYELMVIEGKITSQNIPFGKK